MPAEIHIDAKHCLIFCTKVFSSILAADEHVSEHNRGHAIAIMSPTMVLIKVSQCFIKRNMSPNINLH